MVDVVEDYHGPHSARDPLQDAVEEQEEEEKKEDMDPDRRFSRIDAKIKRKKTKNMSRYNKQNEM